MKRRWSWDSLERGGLGYRKKKMNEKKELEKARGNAEVAKRVVGDAYSRE